MAKRKINFTGPSIKQLGINVEDGKKNRDSKNREAELRQSKIRRSKNSVSNNNNEDTESIKNVGNTTYHKLIRDYLYDALGDAETAEIKISDMQKDLNMTSGTLYKHLKVLRETEFILTKLRYSTKIEKR